MVRRLPNFRPSGSAAWLLTVLVSLPLPTAAQVNKAYADYLLFGQFGEICTMCEAIVLCEAGQEPVPRDVVPAAGSFTLYHVHTRTFWSQVATIWEWFVRNFSPTPLSGHSRPVTIHRVEEGRWQPVVEGEIHVSLEPALFTLSDGHEIDRIGFRWRRSAPIAELGYCQRLPLWDSIDAIRQHVDGGVSR